MSRVVPVEPFSPGEYIQDELDARNWTQADLAAILGRTTRQVVNLVSGRSGITPEIATLLADAFGQDEASHLSPVRRVPCLQGGRRGAQDQRAAGLRGTPRGQIAGVVAEAFLVL